MSELDPLQTLWREAETSRPDTLRHLDVLKARAATLNRTLMWRDVREIGAAALGAVFFGCVAVLVPDLRAVALGMVGLSLWVASVLLVVRFRYRRATPSASVRNALVAEHCWLRAQVALLRWAGLWYVLPLLSGILAFTASNGDLGPGVLAFSLALAGVLIWLNWKAAAALSVTRDAFAAQIHDLDHV